MNKQIIPFNDQLYIINKILTIKQEPPFDLVEELRQYYHSEKTLKKDNKFYFVNQLTEPILEEDGKTTTTTEDRPSVNNSSNQSEQESPFC
jgi:hypothetical protein